MTFPHTPEPYVIFALAIIVPVLIVWVRGLVKRIRALELRVHRVELGVVEKVKPAGAAR